MSLEQNSGLISPLLNRFDLVFVMIDEADNIKDEANTMEILRKLVGEQVREDSECAYSCDELKQYLDDARENYEPRMTAEADSLIQKYYMKMRNSKKIGIRQLESMMRLSQAHAKLMGRNEVVEFDVISVMSLNNFNGIDQNVDEYNDKKHMIHDLLGI